MFTNLLMTDAQLALDCMDMQSFGQDLFDRTSSVRSIQENRDADYVALLNQMDTLLDQMDELEEGTVSVSKSGNPNRKSRRAMRRVQNRRHKAADRLHGKKRKASRKDRMRWENPLAQMGRAQVMWHESCTGEIVPVPVDRGYHEKRYLRTADISRIPDYYVDTVNHMPDSDYVEVLANVPVRGCRATVFVPICAPEAVQGEAI